MGIGMASRTKLPEVSSSSDKLLAAASAILASRNAVDISLSEIAEVSGLNSALIKYYFGGKNGLLVALARRDAGRSIEQLESLLAMDISAIDKMKYHVAGVITTYSRVPYLNRLIHYLIRQGDDKQSALVVDFLIKPLVAAEQSILRQGVAEGVFREVDLLHFYFAVVGACDQFFAGRASMQAVFGYEAPTDQLVEGYIKTVQEMALRFLMPGPLRSA